MRTLRSSALSSRFCDEPESASRNILGRCGWRFLHARAAGCRRGRLERSMDATVARLAGDRSRHLQSGSVVGLASDGETARGRSRRAEITPAGVADRDTRD